MLMDIDGACLCGYLRYEARIDPAQVRICHCTQCQEHSATAFRTGVPVARENFRMRGGAPKIYVKTAQSGAPRALAFCPECGTSIYGSHPENPAVYSLRLGTARQRAELAPRFHMWMRSAMPWLSALGTLPAFAEQPPPGAPAPGQPG
ncbi:MAG: GFA family protein [Burkholderiales bacterium]|nr:GFA family protein [Burkholderiales bacterium]